MTVSRVLRLKAFKQAKAKGFLPGGDRMDNITEGEPVLDSTGIQRVQERMAGGQLASGET